MLTRLVLTDRFSSEDTGNCGQRRKLHGSGRVSAVNSGKQEAQWKEIYVGNRYCCLTICGS